MFQIQHPAQPAARDVRTPRAEAEARHRRTLLGLRAEARRARLRRLLAVLKLGIRGPDASAPGRRACHP